MMATKRHRCVCFHNVQAFEQAIRQFRGELRGFYFITKATAICGALTNGEDALLSRCGLCFIAGFPWTILQLHKTSFTKVKYPSFMLISTRLQQILMKVSPNFHAVLKVEWESAKALQRRDRNWFKDSKKMKQDIETARAQNQGLCFFAYLQTWKR